MERPRLVASDIDGTLLDPMERVSRRTVAAVRRVAASNTPFVLVTGRPPRWIPQVVDAIGVAGLVVCANGGVLYDAAADRVLRATTLAPMLLHDVAHTLYQAVPGCAVAVERVGAGAGTRSDRQFLAEPGYLHAWPDADSEQAPRDEVLGHPAVKMLVRHGGIPSAQLAAAARAVVNGAVTVTYSTGAGLIELSPKGITKATGLAEVAERSGLDAERTLAFGDMPNDVPMLLWAEHGVAMANAHPEVLAVADEITAPNSEDGVALVLERWF
jgi:Cof subfamily protein (haloacid dehalogenase superfamily)